MRYSAYIRQFEVYGYDGVLRTAAVDRDITPKELASLQAHMEYVDRTHTWDKRRGRWIAKTDEEMDRKIRQCLQCGLDLSRQRNRKARFCNQACKQKWYRIRKREREARDRADRIRQARARRKARKAA